MYFRGTLLSSGSRCQGSSGTIERGDTNDQIDIPRGCQLQSTETSLKCNYPARGPGWAYECSPPTTEELQANDNFVIKATGRDSCQLIPDRGTLI